MRALLDADALIKLNRAGVLQHVIASFECTIPQAVYHEAVTQGKAGSYSDANAIEAMLSTSVEIADTPTDSPAGLRLGHGESAVLVLARKTPDALVISDDRRFLTFLSIESIPYLQPSDVIVLLASSATLKIDEAIDALERLRPAIRDSAYRQARESLTSLKEPKR